MAARPTRKNDTGPSALDRIRELDQQRTQIMEGAKAEAMQKVREAVDELNALGFSYRISDEGRGARRNAAESGSRRGTRTVNPERACPICGFLTNPPHDARAHRSQGSDKRAFSADELSVRGLRKVS